MLWFDLGTFDAFAVPLNPSAAAFLQRIWAYTAEVSLILTFTPTYAPSRFVCKPGFVLLVCCGHSSNHTFTSA